MGSGGRVVKPFLWFWLPLFFVAAAAAWLVVSVMRWLLVAG